MPEAIDIDIVSDVVCPWCVIGWLQLDRAIAETGARTVVRWHAFELNPDMPPAGQNLRDHLAAKYGTDARGGDSARARLTALGAELGFRFDYFPEMRMVNTFAAHRLLHWAALQDRAHALKLALFGAYFTDRRDVSDPEVLRDVVARVGLDANEAADVLAQGRFAAEVRKEQAFWRGHGISGVPAIVFQRRHLVSGAQGAPAFVRILRQLAA